MVDPGHRRIGEFASRPTRHERTRTIADEVLINLATGLEDAERVTVAFLVAGAALERGKEVAMWCTKEAVRLALPGHAVGEAGEGCPPLDHLFQQFADAGGRLMICPICVQARRLDDAGFVSTAQLAGATPMFGVARRRGFDGLQLLTLGAEAETPTGASRSPRPDA
jgi:predicted peroxiredoxin